MPGHKANVFGTRIGFYLAAVGSAFGLGNLWRFPYVVAENGGGAFVLLYLFLVFVVGIPLLIAELSLGKITRNSLTPSTAKLVGDRYTVRDIRDGSAALPWWLRALVRYTGTFSLGITIVVLAYYAVISGWVLHFFMQLVFALFRADGFRPEGSLQVLLQNGWLQLLLTLVHLLTVSVIVAKDLEFGLEKWVGYCTPVFVFLLLSLAFRALRLESANEALRFLFYPDFSKLKLASLGQALGHVLFTLSIGFGSMVTFGSYLRDNTYIPMAGFRVGTLDSVISLFSGVMIFPLVLFSGQMFAGPQLLFQSVPRLLTQIPGGLWFGISFFLCLYLASLGASIGLFETVVANWRESRRVARPRGAYTLAGICFVLAVLPALSSNVLSSVRIGDRGLLAFLDAALINWCLPFAAFVICQAVCWMVKPDLLRAEFIDPEAPGTEKIFKHWMFTLRYIVSPIMVLALALALF